MKTPQVNPAWKAELEKVLNEILENAASYDWADLEMLRKFAQKKYNNE